jgi:hypothetical protein
MGTRRAPRVRDFRASLYPTLAKRAPVLGTGRGIVYGLVVYPAHAFVVPAIGLTPPTWKFPPETMIRGVGYHLAYGFALESLMGLLRPHGGSRRHGARGGRTLRGCRNENESHHEHDPEGRVAMRNINIEMVKRPSRRFGAHDGSTNATSDRLLRGLRDGTADRRD